MTKIEQLAKDYSEDRILDIPLDVINNEAYLKIEGSNLSDEIENAFLVGANEQHRLMDESNDIRDSRAVHMIAVGSFEVVKAKIEKAVNLFEENERAWRGMLLDAGIEDYNEQDIQEAVKEFREKLEK